MNVKDCYQQCSRQATVDSRRGAMVVKGISGSRGYPSRRGL